MDDPREIFPSVNERDEVIGSISRSEAHKSPRIIHRVSAVIIYNAKNELLLQRRSKTKDIFPDCWDISVAGHVIFGDDYLATAVQEIAEEVGIIVSPHRLVSVEKRLIRVTWESEFWQIYSLRLTAKEKIMLSKEEVSRTIFVNKEQLSQMLSDNQEPWNTKTKDLFQSLTLF